MYRHNTHRNTLCDVIVCQTTLTTYLLVSIAEFVKQQSASYACTLTVSLM